MEGTWQYTGRHGVGEVAQRSLFSGNRERDKLGLTWAFIYLFSWKKILIAKDNLNMTNNIVFLKNLLSFLLSSL